MMFQSRPPRFCVAFEYSIFHVHAHASRGAGRPGTEVTGALDQGPPLNVTVLIS